MKRRVLLAVGLGLVACGVEAHHPVQNALPVEPPVYASASWNEEGPSPPTLSQTNHSVESQAAPNAIAPEAGVAVLEPVYPFQQVDVLKRPVAGDAAARRNANLSSALCARELRTKKYPFKRVGAVTGIATPVRVEGEIEGVKFRVPGNKSKFGVLDCRLALTLVEFARFLKAASVTQVTVDNFSSSQRAVALKAL